MKIRRLDHSSIDISAIGLGCMTMIGLYGGTDDGESIAAIDAGLKFIDTSDSYGNGSNEELVGRAVTGWRDAVVLATKFGNVRKPDGKPGADGRPEYVIEACEELGTTFVAYSPLGRGFLTGAVHRLDDLREDDRRRDHPRFTPENIAHNTALLGPIEELARSKSCSSAQLALAWTMAKTKTVMPIPGTTHRDHLDANIAAT